MLKWAVTQKRDTKCEVSRDGVPIKRRESAPCKLVRQRETKRRRSSNVANKKTDDNDENKENRYTSTPIKSCEGEALRDIINLTPKERRLTLAKVDDVDYKEFASGRFKQKRKKRCLEAAHSKSDEEFFKPFESVDSHVRSLLVDTKQHQCGGKAKTPHQEIKKLLPTTYAPTLPTYFMEYSPLAESNLLPPSICCSVPRLKSSLDDLYPPNKKARIEHVNDFLHQISEAATLDEENATAKTETCTNVSPLVQRLVDLRFNKNNCDKRRTGVNDSSFINELSLDQLVDAILDSSADSATKSKQTLDSGFRSNSTENSHHINSNYICKCNEKTIINLEEKYNERCIDDVSRKRFSSSCDESATHIKRRQLTDANFTLKRQKCVRRRKNSSVKKLVVVPAVKPPEVVDVSCESDMVSSLASGASQTDFRKTTRRCLNFESPDGGEAATSTPKDEGKVRGIIYLKICLENGELVVQGKQKADDVKAIK